MPGTPPIHPGTGHSERSFPPPRSPASVRSYDLLAAASQSRQESPGVPAYTLDQYLAASMQSLQSGHQTPASEHHGTRRLRSAYPPEPNQSHVEFILVASFDIDRGSVMEHQYPGPISGDETMLAELMLPDQVHNRTQDWTIFFLHKDAGGEEDQEDPSNANGQGKRRRRKRLQQGDNGQEDEEQQDDEESPDGSSMDDEDIDDDIEGPPLIYVLNLVNTKHDSSVKRGAIVKAMAVCTRHPFLHIYKPLLLLALEEYFRNPVPETLASLYSSVNAMDLSLIPKFSLLERTILQSSSVKTMFKERFDRMIELQKRHETAQGTDSPWKSPRDPSNSATSKYKEGDTHEFETKIVYNGISVPIKIPTTLSLETVGDFSIIKLIQTLSGPHSSNPQPFALHPHLTTAGAYTHPVIVLVNALLTQKRVCFLGHNQPSGEVAEAVLAACALGSGGILRGFTRHAFPYTDLTKIDDLLRVPGFIAGVTNPAFANKPEWWDILCDLSSGRIKISNRIEPPQMNEGLLSFQAQNPTFAAMISPTATSSSSSSSQSPANDATGDTAFMESIQRAISARLGENTIRAMWRDWTVKLTRIAAAYEEAVYGASALYMAAAEADAGAFGVRGHGYVWPDEPARQRELAANAHRIEGWRVTRSYFALVQDQAQVYETARPVAGLDLAHQHDRLRTQKLRADDAAAVILALEAAVRTPQEICHLLTVTPESHGGIFYIALGLLHPRPDVRRRTVALMERIVSHEAGKHFWFGLSKFAQLAFFRIKKDLEAKGDDGAAAAKAGQKEVEAT